MAESKTAESMWWKVSTVILALLVVLLIILIGRAMFLTEPEPEYGIFIAKPMWDQNNPGREADDLRNVAIILRSTSLEHTKRWLTDIKKQRKSTNDLPIYIYPNSNNMTNYKELKKAKENFDNVKLIMNSNGSVKVADALRNPQVEYLIEAEDTQYIGADFADYYFLGKNVMKLNVTQNETLQCVCGGSTFQPREFHQPSQGDVFWLMDYNYCDIGHMQPREEYEVSHSTDTPLTSGSLPICLRPEVPRIALNGGDVTKMSWNLSRMDPNLLTISQLNKRMKFDLKNAKKMPKLEWDELKTHDDQLVYKFPWKNTEDLNHYFDNEQFEKIMESKMYKDTIPLFVHGRKVYVELEESKEST